VPYIPIAKARGFTALLGKNKKDNKYTRRNYINANYRLYGKFNKYGWNINLYDIRKLYNTTACN